MTTVLVTAPVRPQDRAAMEAADGGYRFVYNQTPAAEELAAAEVIIGDVSLAQVAQAPNLKWLQITSAGTDAYTQNGRLPQGIVLTNVSGAFGRTISEYVLTLILTFEKKLHLYRDNQSKCQWLDHGQQDSPVGKRVLILGAGDIGCATARLLKLFQCHTVGIRRVPRAIPPEFDEMYTLDQLDEQLPLADIVVCALPNTPQTRGLFHRRRLALLNPDALLINVGRGNLIDCDALYDALERWELAGAALDVTDPEPLPPTHPLWSCTNVLITPHITGGSFGHLEATSDAICQILCENLRRYAQGAPLKNVVDLETGYRVTQD